MKYCYKREIDDIKKFECFMYFRNKGFSLLQNQVTKV